MSKFNLPETQFESTVKDKIACKTHLEYENYWFKHIFGILIKFPIQLPKKTLQNLVQSQRKTVTEVDLPETPFESTVKDKIACKTHLEYENYWFKQIFRILIKFPIQ